MPPYFGLTGRKLHAAIWTESLFAVTTFGYVGAAAGGVLNMPAFREQFPTIDVTDAPASQKHYKSTIQGTWSLVTSRNWPCLLLGTWLNYAKGTVVAVSVLFGVFGALGTTFIGDLLGRRKTIFLAAFLQLIGSILMGSSYSLGQFIVGRVFTGLGTGGITATVPVWQSELSRAESRGSHVSSFGIYCGSGLSLALWLAFGFSFASGSVTWRFPISGGVAILDILIMVFIFQLPESPRWLKLKDRHEEARQILVLLSPNEPEVVEKQIKDIETALRISSHQASLKYMFSMGPQRILHRVLLASAVQVMLQFTGVNAIAYYTPTIYEESLGFPPVEAAALAAASQACIILGGVVCAYTVDRFGRRSLMMISAGGMAICLACVTGLVSSGSSAALKASVFFLYLYYFVYTLGWIGIPFLYASEIAPVQLRAAICGLSTAISWLFNFLVVEITPVGFNDIGYRYFIIYTCTCASFVPIIYFFYPETAGRSLEEIDAIFAGSNSVLGAVKVAKEMPKMHLADIDVEDKLEKMHHDEQEEAERDAS